VLILLRLTYITYIVFPNLSKIKFLANLVARLRGSGNSGDFPRDFGFPRNFGPGPKYLDF
jgi:hypothetical protein